MKHLFVQNYSILPASSFTGVEGYSAVDTNLDLHPLVQKSMAEIINSPV